MSPGRLGAPAWPLLFPVPTGEEAAAFDQAAQDGGIPGAVLMESAGRSAADCIQAICDELGRTGPVVVLAGPGNNGGDGVVLARTLHARGVPVYLWTHPRRPDPDPCLHGHAVPRLETFPGEAPELRDASDGGWAAGHPAPALFVDALLGTGLVAPPRGSMAHWISTLARVARSEGIPIVSLDVPSGVVANTGDIPGSTGADASRAGGGLQAAVTLTFGALKRGLVYHPGRARAGRILVLEMGFPPWPRRAASAHLITGAWAHAVLPTRPPVTHKRAEGCLLLVAGGPGMGGAAILAARAALRTGVGLLRVACHPDHRGALHRAVPEAVLPPVEEPGVMEALLAQADAVVVGPGMGTDPEGLPTRPFLAAMRTMAHPETQTEDRVPPLVLDADALTLLAQGAFRLPTAPAGEWASACHLLTPHPGEMGRIHPEGRGEVPARQAQGAADAWGVICLLKGAPSLVAAPGDPDLWISASGGSAFATGGMGDVLAGVAGALMARGLPARDAAGLALHLTGRGADHALTGGRSGDALLPSDLIDALPEVLEEVASHPVPPTAGTHPRNPRLSPAVLLDLAPAR